MAGGCGSAADGGVSLVLLGGFVLLVDGAYVVGGGSFVADDESSSSAGLLSVERVVRMGVLGPELA